MTGEGQFQQTQPPQIPRLRERSGRLLPSLVWGGFFGLLLAAVVGVVAPSPPALALGVQQARQGGLTIPANPARIERAPRFGTRVLKRGMTGPDVRVLRSMISSRTLGLRSIGVSDLFDGATERSVKRFQARVGLGRSGVVNGRTAEELVGSMPRTGASWYGPPLYGNSTACGKRFTPRIIGVAHKTLPCGTRVLIGYRGRFLLTRVIDRGPYTPGRTWDLSNGARVALGYTGIDPVRHLVVGG